MSPNLSLVDKVHALLDAASEFPLERLKVGSLQLVEAAQRQVLLHTANGTRSCTHPRLVCCIIQASLQRYHLALAFNHSSSL